ncbi:hypothetical protein HZY88_08870 [Aerococcaceae bacterium DSM 111176]|nr:hypothetical protein [Aerococcaceae bacterium DSM 111176]
MQTFENTNSTFVKTDNIQSTRLAAKPKVNERVIASPRALTRGQKTVISVSVCVFLLLIFTNLFVQFKDAQIVQEIERYQLSVGELNTMAEGVRNEIHQAANYEDVKQAAQEENMTIEQSRVKDIQSEDGQ